MEQAAAVSREELSGRCAMGADPTAGCVRTTAGGPKEQTGDGCRELLPRPRDSLSSAHKLSRGLSS